jgi:hypothetical protein
MFTGCTRQACVVLAPKNTREAQEDSVNCFTAAIQRILAFTYLFKANGQDFKDEKSITLESLPGFQIWAYDDGTKCDPM